KEKKNSEKKATLGGSYDYKQLLREISKSRLDTSKLKDNDHRILGQKLDLFSFSEVAPGMVFWHNNGVLVRNKLIEYWRKKHTLAGYTEVQTPQIMDSKLWKVSGHWDKYKDNNFVTDYEGRNFLVKPMNCPGGIIIYRNSPKSYKDLPLRVGELGLVHRTELSGVLAGLLRVIQFTQDDAHLYCADEKQASEEIKNVVKLLEEFYNEFGLPIDHVELSTRPEKRIGSDKMWDTAEKILEDVLKKTKLKYKINKGDGAFYGPKIDFHVKDSLGRTWQLGTIQLDFSLPERFDLTYIGKDNNPKRPIMIHRVIYGSLERFIAVLLEHTNGQLPAWLSPIQARILSFTERNKEYSEKVLEEIKKEIPGIRIDTDFRDVPLNNKVREAELQKIPFIIVLGDKEEKER
ncbi:threonine--tRNA ligase, partial [Candidatus Pacearchaeota archaeon CG10_big_fil_rev_8_21_14_0_10_35_13]